MSTSLRPAGSLDPSGWAEEGYQATTKLLLVFEFTFPDDENTPATFFEFTDLALVAFLVTSKLRRPEIRAS